MEKIDRIASHISLREAFDAIELCEDRYKDHKIFLRRKDWCIRLYWEMKTSEPVGYKLCEITENCQISYLIGGLQTNVNIIDSMASDWEVWVEVKF